MAVAKKDVQVEFSSRPYLKRSVYVVYSLKKGGEL